MEVRVKNCGMKKLESAVLLVEEVQGARVRIISRMYKKTAEKLVKCRWLSISFSFPTTNLDKMELSTAGSVDVKTPPGLTHLSFAHALKFANAHFVFLCWCSWE